MPLTSASAFARPSTHHHPLLLPYTVTPTLPRPRQRQRQRQRPLLALSFRGDGNCLRPVRCCHSAVSKGSHGALDPELRFVLELATDSELYEIERILFGPSYFSPLLKSITSRGQLGHSYIEDLEERDDFIAGLESRFLFLAADARSTLRGWRPSYRNVLLAVREKLNVPCSRKLSTEDLEAEIFLHVLKVHASEFPSFWEELQNIIIKGSGILTLSKLYQVVSTRLTGKMLLEAASYQVKREFIKKSGQLASINLESRAALIAAKQGLSGAASRYLGLRSVMHFLGPMLWGTVLADVVIQMLGTDYARILPAIYAFAQIRITRTYPLRSDNNSG